MRPGRCLQGPPGKRGAEGRQSPCLRVAGGAAPRGMTPAERESQVRMSAVAVSAVHGRTCLKGRGPQDQACDVNLRPRRRGGARCAPRGQWQHFKCKAGQTRSPLAPSAPLTSPPACGTACGGRCLGALPVRLHRRAGPGLARSWKGHSHFQDEEGVGGSRGAAPASPGRGEATPQNSPRRAEGGPGAACPPGHSHGAPLCGSWGRSPRGTEGSIAAVAAAGTRTQRLFLERGREKR